MSVGGQAGTATINQNLTDLTVGLRTVMEQIKNLSTFVNGGGNGLTALVNLGYSNTANPANPGGVSDAQYALNMINYLNTVCGVYYGTVQQGGSGGTGAAMFNFDNVLAQMWAGQV